MNFFIIDQYYPKYLKSFYSVRSGRSSETYFAAGKRLMSGLFGTSDFYSFSLKKLGHKAIEVVANDANLQKLWVKEYLCNFNLSLGDQLLDKTLKKIGYLNDRLMSRWEERVLYEQIKKERPQIIYVQNIGFVSGHLLRKIKPLVKLVVGQIASPIPPLLDCKAYDLIITSFPHFVPLFQKKGVACEYLKLAFEPKVLTKVGKTKKLYDLTFVGGISRAHKKGLELLNDLAERRRIDVWGYGKNELDKKSKLYKYHHGEIWGKEMYRVLSESKITINRHIDVAENFANNTRLYESTGCGAMLITDKKKNFGEIFKIGKEIETYGDINDLVAKINFYMTHPQKRDSIARAGQKRTLKDHNYLKRMGELVRIIEKYL